METLVQAAEEKFNQNNYSEVLTEFTKEWKDNEGLEALLNFIAPKVPVTRRFEITTSNTTNPNSQNSQNKPCGISNFSVYSCNSYANITYRTCFVTRFFVIWKYRKAAQFLAYGASPRAVI